MLKIYNSYSRKEAHDIFDPFSDFTPSGGSWGQHGIVKIQNSKDFVLFVTFGQSQADHTFDESITHEGVLSWQSQPRQSLKSNTIQLFINQDHHKNNIHLFLRTSKKDDYTYFGRLKYLKHDAERENPVYFQWQIIDWESNPEIFKKIGLKLVYDSQDEIIPERISNSLLETDIVKQSIPERKGVSTKQFRNQKQPDYGEKDAKNRKLGLACEKLVMKYEEQRLNGLGLKELTNKIRHISKDVGDFVGYDILSYDETGEEIYIEVKGTKGPNTSRFYISKNEVEFSKNHASQYYIYRVYNYDFETNSGKFFKVQGDVTKNFVLTAENYIVSI